MTVYVDRTHKKFKNVIDDPEYNHICMEDLSQCGLKGYSNLGFYDFDLCSEKSVQQEFIYELTSLSFKMQVEIANLLLKEWHAERLNFYDDYQDFISYYDEDDFTPAELQEEYLSALKDDELASDFEEINGANDIEVVFDYLEDNLPNFKYWYITGYMQGEFSYVWTFDKHDEKLLELENFAKIMPRDQDTFKETFEDYLETVLYGTFVTITDCDENGDSTGEQQDNAEEVADLYIGGDNPFVSDECVDEYMKKHYQMDQAEVIVTYAQIKLLKGKAKIKKDTLTVDKVINMYSLYDCDAWCSWSSLRLNFETIDRKALNDRLKQMFIADPEAYDLQDIISADEHGEVKVDEASLKDLVKRQEVDDLVDIVQQQLVNFLYLEVREINLDDKTVELVGQYFKDCKRKKTY